MLLAQLVGVSLAIHVALMAASLERVAAALGARAPELLSGPPSIERVDVLAAKLPPQDR